MRRMLLALCVCAAALSLSACGNKGPLVRASSHAAAPVTAPAPAASAPTPASAVSARASTGPAYLSPSMPATTKNKGH